mgnify:CR=1 FL=1
MKFTLLFVKSDEWRKSPKKGKQISLEGKVSFAENTSKYPELLLWAETISIWGQEIYFLIGNIV